MGSRDETARPVPNPFAPSGASSATRHRPLKSAMPGARPYAYRRPPAGHTGAKPPSATVSTDPSSRSTGAINPPDSPPLPTVKASVVPSGDQLGDPSASGRSSTERTPEPSAWRPSGETAHLASSERTP